MRALGALFDWPERPFARARPWQRWLAGAVGMLAVASDLTVLRAPSLGMSLWRPALGLAAMALLVALGGGAGAVGLRLRPLPGGRFWWRTGLSFAGVAAAMLAIAVAVACARGTWVLPPVHDAEALGLFFAGACVHAPITEELLYRVAICAPLALCIGPWATIAVAAVANALLHQLWGTFEPTHLLAGAVAAWAYLRSSCLWLPIALHMFGNGLALAVLAVQFWLGAR